MGIQKISVEIEYEDSRIKACAVKGKLLSGVLEEHGVRSVLPCAGMGRCGRCRVLFLEGAPEPNSFDIKFLTAKEISKGIRILCKCVLKSDCKVRLESKAIEDAILVETIEVKPGQKKCYDKYAIAVDIGTTTIAAALIGFDNETSDTETIETASCVNHQREYGSDVISRIAAAEDGSILARLKEIVIEDIESLIDRLKKEIDKEPELIVMAGNTTMLYLFNGEDVEPLGHYPYVADKISCTETKLKGIDTFLFPGISAFVGADIVAGIYALSLQKKDEKNKLLIDLGTNGEIAYFNGGKLFVSSTAAGPVFEAGGISCGMASVPGAISHVSLKDKSLSVIGDVEPKGICGTGVIETVSELRSLGIINKAGLLEERYFESGYPLDEKGEISFTQKDIRNVQLAKAAVYCGITVLIKDTKPDKVYICGGFGSHIDIDKIMNLKMFPDSFRGKVSCEGNTSLKGCVKFAKESLCGRRENAKRELEEITQTAIPLILANDENFENAYIEAMNF